MSIFCIFKKNSENINSAESKQGNVITHNFEKIKTNKGVFPLFRQFTYFSNNQEKQLRKESFTNKPSRILTKNPLFWTQHCKSKPFKHRRHFYSHLQGTSKTLNEEFFGIVQSFLTFVQSFQQSFKVFIKGEIIRVYSFKVFCVQSF